MAKQIRCECGYIARGDSDDAVVGRDRGAHEHRPSRGAGLHRPAGHLWLDRAGLSGGSQEVMTRQRPFDPARYKETTREQWQAAAEAWNRWGPALERVARAGDRGDARPGRASALTRRVLDVAAGAGGQTLAAARRVGPERAGAGHRRRAGDPGLRRRQRPSGRARQRRRPRDGRRAAGRRTRPLRRGHQPGRADLLPRPAAGARPGSCGRCGPAAGWRDRLLDAGAQPVLLHPGLGDPRARAAGPTRAGPAGSVQPRRAGVPPRTR